MVDGDDVRGEEAFDGGERRDGENGAAGVVDEADEVAAVGGGVEVVGGEGAGSGMAERLDRPAILRSCSPTWRLAPAGDG